MRPFSATEDCFPKEDHKFHYKLEISLQREKGKLLKWVVTQVMGKGSSHEKDKKYTSSSEGLLYNPVLLYIEDKSTDLKRSEAVMLTSAPAHHNIDIGVLFVLLLNVMLSTPAL